MDKPNSKRQWIPSVGQTYFYIAPHGDIREDRYSGNSIYESDMIKFGNCFKSKIDALLAWKDIYNIFKLYNRL